MNKADDPSINAVKVTVLGCGSSGGVPLINGEWGRCDPSEPRNRRRRPSVLVETAGKTILVDTGPDMREQFLAFGPPERIDAVILTHYHADHLNGLDDIRHYVSKQGHTIPLYVLPEVGAHVREHFHYVVKGFAWYPPLVDIREIEPEQGIIRVDVEGVPVDMWRQNHGRVDTIGMRFGPFAYSTDCVDLSPDILGQLRDWQLKLWMADAARIKPHPAHAHLDMALDWMRQVQPERGLLTHMSEFLDYKTTRAACPAFVEPAYDGMELLIET
ncbi:MAG: MBL fold metallo-hydrolase [Geminicoccus sp.]|nr:MBL fold metallo-hydrolase [Geminicoccus sp.]